MTGIRIRSALCVMLAVLITTVTPPAHGVTIYESTPDGTPTGGGLLLSDPSLMVQTFRTIDRFDLTQIGLHARRSTGTGTRSVDVDIVPVVANDSIIDPTQVATLSIASTTISGIDATAFYTAPLSGTIDPGWYAAVFNGPATTAERVLVDNFSTTRSNPNILPYSIPQAGGSHLFQGFNDRVVVEGTPSVAPPTTDFFFESASPAMFSNSANPVDGVFWNAAVMEITMPTRITEIGARMRNGSGQLFGAIVALTSASDVPDTDLLNPAGTGPSSDVVATTLIDVANPTDDYSGNLIADLNPGFYAVVIGTGQFGAAGTANIASAADLVTPGVTQLLRVGTFWTAQFPSSQRRIFASGVPVPEPTTATLAVMAALGWCWGQRRKRRDVVG